MNDLFARQQILPACTDSRVGTYAHPVTVSYWCAMQMTKPKIAVIIGSIRPNRQGDKPAKWIADLAAQSG